MKKYVTLCGILFAVIALAACGKDAPAQTPTVAPTAATPQEATPTPGPTVTPVFETKEDFDWIPLDSPLLSYDASNPDKGKNVIPMEESVTVDLDGDGTEETLRVEYSNRDRINIWINDTCYSSEELGAYFETLDSTRYFLLDLDETDTITEIAVYEKGPSGDPYTSVFRYANKEVKFIGGFTDEVTDDTVFLPGNGTVIARTRFGFLQTWFGTGIWALNEDGMLRERIPECYFFEQENCWPITLKQDLTMFAEADVKAESISFSRGDVVYFTKIYHMTEEIIENRGYYTAWVEATGEDGVTGWFYCDKQAMFADGAAYYEDDIFDNLNHAD